MPHETQWMPHERRVCCHVVHNGVTYHDLEGEWIKPRSDGSLDVRFVFGDSRIAFQDWSYLPSYRQSYLNPRSIRSFNGLKLRICKENLKGTGLLIAENFNVTEPDQILLWGPPLLDAKLASGPSAKDTYLYQWGGLNGSTFKRSSGKIDPSKPMMLANTAGNEEKANCRFSSSGGVPCIRTLLQEGETYQANSFLNVSYYSTSGSTSNKSMNKEIATQVALAKVHHDLELAIRNQPGRAAVIVCKSCFQLKPVRRRSAKAHALTCSKLVLTWNLKKLKEFDPEMWVENHLQ